MVNATMGEPKTKLFILSQKEEKKRKIVSESGIPQGSLLEFVHTENALLADDCFYYRSAEMAVTKLQNSINILVDWLRKWRIQVNENRTQTVMHTRGLKIYQSQLEKACKSKPKYLSIIFDKKLTWSNPVQTQTNLIHSNKMLLPTFCQHQS